MKYWAYILIYVDDILCVHHDPWMSLDHIDKYFKMKPGSIMDPTFYLGARLKNGCDVKWCIGLGHEL
jgi:hypothetical protein